MTGHSGVSDGQSASASATAFLAAGFRIFKKTTGHSFAKKVNVQTA